eukprot:TRINITY_DN615_c0_g2_i3.p1 TRINITY_DN615_c0_g2~~TRINITY_DN615_c0_g2_i3.p1  ORF type:complete len:2840 (+),score=775.02 TRINITY_DN615_c0_g2_i3:113-8632(+)
MLTEDGGSFWATFAAGADAAEASALEKLLESDSCSVEELLEQEEIIQEFKASNEKLLARMCRPDAIKVLMEFITLEPPENASEARAFRYPFVAVELMACASEQFLDAICSAENAENLDSLWRFLESTPPDAVNPVLAGYFERTVTAMMRKKRECVVQYLRGGGGEDGQEQRGAAILERLLQRLHMRSLAQLLLLLVACENADEVALPTEGLGDKLLQMFCKADASDSSKSSEEDADAKCENAALVVLELLERHYQETLCFGEAFLREVTSNEAVVALMDQVVSDRSAAVATSASILASIMIRGVRCGLDAAIHAVNAPSETAALGPGATPASPSAPLAPLRMSPAASSLHEDELTNIGGSVDELDSPEEEAKLERLIHNEAARAHPAAEDPGTDAVDPAVSMKRFAWLCDRGSGFLTDLAAQLPRLRGTLDDALGRSDAAHDAPHPPDKAVLGGNILEVIQLLTVLVRSTATQMTEIILKEQLLPRCVELALTFTWSSLLHNAVLALLLEVVNSASMPELRQKLLLELLREGGFAERLVAEYSEEAAQNSQTNAPRVGYMEHLNRFCAELRKYATTNTEMESYLASVEGWTTVVVPALDERERIEKLELGDDPTHQSALGMAATMAAVEQAAAAPSASGGESEAEASSRPSLAFNSAWPTKVQDDSDEDDDYSPKGRGVNPLVADDDFNPGGFKATFDDHKPTLPAFEADFKADFPPAGGGGDDFRPEFPTTQLHEVTASFDASFDSGFGGASAAGAGPESTAAWAAFPESSSGASDFAAFPSVPPPEAFAAFDDTPNMGEPKIGDAGSGPSSPALPSGGQQDVDTEQDGEEGEGGKSQQKVWPTSLGEDWNFDDDDDEIPTSPKPPAGLHHDDQEPHDKPMSWATFREANKPEDDQTPGEADSESGASALSSGGSFWSTFGAQSGAAEPSRLEKLLDNPGSLIEDLLDEEDIIQEFKAGNAKLLQRLAEVSEVEALIDFMTKEADEDASQSRCYRFPFVSVELFAINAGHFFDVMARHSDLFLRFWRLILETPAEDVNAVLAGYFARAAASMLHGKRGDDMVALIQDLQLVDRVWEGFMARLHSRSLAELFVTLLCGEGEKPMQLFPKANVEGLAADLLKVPRCEADVDWDGLEADKLENITILVTMLLDQGNSFYDGIFLRSFHERATLEKLVDMLLLDGPVPVCSAEGMLNMLLRKAFGSTQENAGAQPPSSPSAPVLPASEPAGGALGEAEDGAEAADEAAVLRASSPERGHASAPVDSEEEGAALMAILCEQLPRICTQIDGYAMQNPQSPRASYVGSTTLALVEIVLTLVRTKSRAVLKTILAEKMLPRCFKLLFGHKWCSLLHNAVQSLTSELLSEGNENLEERSAIIVNFLGDGNFFGHTSDAFAWWASDAVKRCAALAGCTATVLRAWTQLRGGTTQDLQARPAVGHVGQLWVVCTELRAFGCVAADVGKLLEGSALWCEIVVPALKIVHAITRLEDSETDSNLEKKLMAAAGEDLSSLPSPGAGAPSAQDDGQFVLDPDFQLNLTEDTERSLGWHGSEEAEANSPESDKSRGAPRDGDAAEAEDSLACLEPPPAGDVRRAAPGPPMLPPNILKPESASNVTAAPMLPMSNEPRQSSVELAGGYDSGENSQDGSQLETQEEIQEEEPSAPRGATASQEMGGFGSFWNTFGASQGGGAELSPLERKLQNGCTVAELLDEDEIIQEFKAGNSQLVSALCQPEAVHTLIQYVTCEPPADACHQRCHRYPFVAVELMTVGADQFFDVMSRFEDLALLVEFWSFLQATPPADVNPVLAGYFARTAGVLLSKHKAELAQQLRACQRSNQLADLLECFLERLHERSLAELLARMLQAEHISELAFSVKGLVERLVQRLSTDDDFSGDMHESVGLVTSFLFDTKDSCSFFDDVLDQLLSPSIISLLSGLVFSERPSAVAAAMQILSQVIFHVCVDPAGGENSTSTTPSTSLLSPSLSPTPNPPPDGEENLAQLENEALVEMPANLSPEPALIRTPPRSPSSASRSSPGWHEGSKAAGLLREVCKQLPKAKAILASAVERSRRKQTNGMQPSLGSATLDVINFLKTLVRTNCPLVLDILLQEQLLHVCAELFFCHPCSNLLHNAIMNLIGDVLAGADYASKRMKLILDLLREGGFAAKLVQEYRAEYTIHGSVLHRANKVFHMSQLHCICWDLHDYSIQPYNTPEVDEFLSSFPGWRTDVLPVMDLTNKMHKEELGGGADSEDRRLASTESLSCAGSAYSGAAAPVSFSQPQVADTSEEQDDGEEGSTAIDLTSRFDQMTADSQPQAEQEPQQHGQEASPDAHSMMSGAAGQSAQSSFGGTTSSELPSRYASVQPSWVETHEIRNAAGGSVAPPAVQSAPTWPTAAPEGVQQEPPPSTRQQPDFADFQQLGPSIPSSSPSPSTEARTTETAEELPARLSEPPQQQQQQQQRPQQQQQAGLTDTLFSQPPAVPPVRQQQQQGQADAGFSKAPSGPPAQVQQQQQRQQPEQKQQSSFFADFQAWSPLVEGAFSSDKDATQANSSLFAMLGNSSVHAGAAAASSSSSPAASKPQSSPQHQQQQQQQQQWASSGLWPSSVKDQPPAQQQPMAATSSSAYPAFDFSSGGSSSSQAPPTQAWSAFGDVPGMQMAQSQVQQAAPTTPGALQSGWATWGPDTQSSPQRPTGRGFQAPQEAPSSPWTADFGVSTAFASSASPAASTSHVGDGWAANFADPPTSRPAPTPQSPPPFAAATSTTSGASDAAGRQSWVADFDPLFQQGTASRQPVPSAAQPSPSAAPFAAAAAPAAVQQPWVASWPETPQQAGGGAGSSDFANFWPTSSSR